MIIGAGGCRLMCAWDTRDSDVDQFVVDLKHLLVKSLRELSSDPVNRRKL